MPKQLSSVTRTLRLNEKLDSGIHSEAERLGNCNHNFSGRKASRVYILIIILTATDVFTTIVADWMGFHEANKYVLFLMHFLGFYGGLLAYLIIIVVAMFLAFYIYKKYSHTNTRIFRSLNACVLLGLWGFAFTRFVPVLNNASLILGFYLLTRSSRGHVS